MEDVNLESLVVNGKNHVEPVETEIGIFYVRPLTVGEKAALKIMPWKSINASIKTDMKKGSVPKDMDVTIGMDVMRAAQDEQKFATLAHGLSCRGKMWTLEKIKNMTISEKILDVLFEKILVISEVSKEELRPFSEFRSGLQPGDSDS